MIGFFLLCISILFITKGELGALAGVYTISFLSVMALFGLGNILLKIRRARLPRPERASGWALFIAIGAVLAALVGNAVMHPAYLWVFIKYFIPTLAIVAIMLYRIELLRLILFIAKASSKSARHLLTNKMFMQSGIRKIIREINAQEFVYFTKGDNIVNINKVMLYILKNEDTHKIKIVALENESHQVPKHLASDIDVLDRAYPEFVVDFIVMQGHFGPQLIDELSIKWNIPKNFMFIGSPGDHFPYQIAELGGVRLVI
jgi:amino acid transporter